jgi:LPXTG-motif cell wall-anchored protein
MKIRRNMRALVAVAAVGVAMVGPAAGAAYGAAAPKTTDCVAHLTDAHTGSVQLSASPAAGDVAPGADITITARWDTQDWDELNKTLACVTSDGTFSAALSGGEKPADNDGEFVWHLAVPADAPAGTNLCVRGVIFGNPLTGDDVQSSDATCFRVAAAVAPVIETTTPAPPAAQPEIQVISASPADSPPPAVAVAPQVEQAPEPAVELPRTGSSTGPLVVGGAACLLSGGIALAAGRRRPARDRA